jgi:hypothetical protein
MTSQQSERTLHRIKSRGSKEQVKNPKGVEFAKRGKKNME